MADANVTKIDALEQYHESLAQTQFRIAKVVEELHVEISRITRSIEMDAPAYWQSEFKTISRRLVEAEDALARCLLTTHLGDTPPCGEHRNRVRKLKGRRSEVEEKLRAVKAAQQHWHKTSSKLRLRVQQLTNAVEADLPLARQHLNNLITPLKNYAQLSRPDSKLPPASDS
jgi:uncharacterized protein YukE